MYICTSQSLFSHLYVVNEGLNRHCNVQLDIGIRADELGITVLQTVVEALYPVHQLVIPMHICTSQSLFSHSYVVNE
jgi:hypothetical protein